jgi:hypothetical protein
MSTAPKERPIPPTYGKNDRPEWKCTMSAPDNSVGVITMIPDRVIPVIFVPGIMGSNLVEADPKEQPPKRWRMDDKQSALEWAGSSRGAEFRKQYLQPAKMKVDGNGRVPPTTPHSADELRRRGWGEVAAMSYGDFLVWLDAVLNDHQTAHWDSERSRIIGKSLQALKGEEALSKEDVALSYKYSFPVYACGYNWLDDNLESAKRLGNRIDEIIKHYRAMKMKCEKVILVTH